VRRTHHLTSLPLDDDMRTALFKFIGEVFEVLADAGFLDVELRTSSTSPRKITLVLSQSIDATRIFPPSSRLKISVVLPAVPRRLKYIFGHVLFIEAAAPIL